MTAEQTPEARRHWQEHEAWCALDFIRDGGELGETNRWVPAEVAVDDGPEAKGYPTACEVGSLYALQLVAHMRDYPDEGSVDCLHLVVGDMMKRDQWTGVEIGFFYALGEILVNGCVRMSLGDKHTVVAVVQAS